MLIFIVFHIRYCSFLNKINSNSKWYNCGDLYSVQIMAIKVLSEGIF